MPRSAMMEWGAITAIVKKVQKEGWERQIRPWRFQEEWIDPQLVLGKAVLRNEELTQRKVLEAKAKSRPLIKTKYLARMEDMLGLSEEDWKAAFRSILKHSNASKKREFVFKFFNQLTRTNIEFCGVGIKDSPKCTYCDCKKQDYKHLFVDCPATIELRDAVEQYWFKGAHLSLKEWMLGIAMATTSEEKARGYIAMELNHLIYQVNHKGQLPSLKHLKNRLNMQRKIEEEIANRHNKMMAHLTKWDEVKKWMG